MDNMEQLVTKTYLKNTSLKLLENWSVQYLLESKFSYNDNFELMPIGSFLIKSRLKILIEDDKTYQRVTVKINNNGVVPRDIEIGKNIGTKQQYLVKTGQFLMSKIDARNGAFGLVPENLDSAIVTNDFPVFDVDKSVINPEFLVLITTTKEFIKFAQSCSSGTTNRQRIDIDLFLNVKIPLPSLHEQNRIVEAYNAKIKLAEEQEQEATKLEEGIERFLFKELGLQEVAIKPFSKGVINLFQFSSTFGRWDIHKDSSNSLSSLQNGKYPVKTLSEIFDFKNRSWNKKEYVGEYFKYVELGAVDPLKGILESKKILVKKAPSRATQKIQYGDLIIGTTRPYLKRFAIVNDKFDGNIASSGFQIIAPSNNYNLEFLLEYLKSDYGVKQFELYMTGALYPAITSKDLRKVLIPIPPINLQNKIANTIKQIKNEIEELLTNTLYLRDSAKKEFENEIFKPCN